MYPHPENMGRREKKKNYPYPHHLNTRPVSIVERFLLFFFERSGCSSCLRQKMQNSEGLECVDDNTMLLRERKTQASAVLQGVSFPKQLRATGRARGRSLQPGLQAGQFLGLSAFRLGGTWWCYHLVSWSPSTVTVLPS